MVVFEVSDVTDVLVSSSSMVTELCDGFLVVRIGILWNHSTVLSPKKKACSFLHRCTERGVV